MQPSRPEAADDHRAAVLAGFLGWTLDAFDFFLVVMTLTAIAKEFHQTDAAVTFSLTLTLAFRPVGAFIFGLLDLIVILILLIPGAVVGVAVAAAVTAAGLTWNPLTIALVVVLGGLAVLALLWLFAMINVPAAVFFQAYPLMFLGSRYPALDAVLHPAPPPAPPAPPAPAPAPA